MTLEQNPSAVGYQLSIPSIERGLGASWLLSPTEVPPVPGPGHPSPSLALPCRRHLKTLELPGPVILGALFVLCFLLQPLQSLGQQLSV